VGDRERYRSMKHGVEPGNSPEEIVANILLVDDHPANLLALEAILSPLEQRLIRASSGREALEWLNRMPFAVVLLDVRMPELDGFSTAGLIRNRSLEAPVPIIFLTAADTDPADILRGYKRGAVDFLMKPFEADILYSKVAVFVELYRKEELLRRQAAQLRKQELEALENRSENRFHQLLDAIPIGVVVTDTERRPYYWNRSILLYIGEQAKLGGTLLEQIHPEDTAHFNAQWTTAEHGRAQFELRFRLRRSDACYRWHLGRGVPQFGEMARLTGWILTATDIEDQHQALMEAQAANRIKDEFLTIVSHELRNPLNAIIGWVHLLGSGGLDEDRTRRAVETIERNVKLQVSLIDEILDLSRIVRNKMRLKTRPIDLVSSVQSTLTALRPAAEAKRQTVEWVHSDEPVFVNGDPERMQQIISNLVSNAIKFTPNDGRLQIVLDHDQRDARLTVTDNGLGISQEFLPHVFEAFTQADSGTTRQHSGLGLGLAISKRLIELHSGSIRAESAGLNQGASFVVTFPLLPAQSRTDQQQSIATAVHPESLNGLTIMIVDDDPDTREILTEILKGHGAEVMVAASAREALESIENSAPDVLVSDIAMPGADGMALVQAVKQQAAERGRPIVTIAVTGLGTPQHRRSALEAGFGICMNKPIEPARLIDYIIGATRN
jgi:signal transduction histidine kinase